MFTLRRRAIEVPPRPGTLLSGQRGQTHAVEQLRSLFMEDGSPLMGGSRTQVSGFNVRHTLRLRPYVRFANRIAEPRAGSPRAHSSTEGRVGRRVRRVIHDDVERESACVSRSEAWTKGVRMCLRSCRTATCASSSSEAGMRSPAAGAFSLLCRLQAACHNPTAEEGVKVGRVRSPARPQPRGRGQR